MAVTDKLKGMVEELRRDLNEVNERDVHRDAFLPLIPLEQTWSWGSRT